MSKRAVLFAFVAVALAGTARADYVCQTEILPAAAGSPYGYGDGGYVVMETMTGKNCTGTIVGTFSFCSTGATSSSCASAANCGVSYLYTSAELQHLNSLLEQSMLHDQSVIVARCLNQSIPQLVHFYSY
jgi:hypothetical protein